MKLTHITAHNYQRLTRVDIAVRAPLLFIAGPNEQGKTSLADAVYHACNGEARRVKLKKEYGALVHDGNKTGIVALSFAGDPPTEASVKIPDGKRAGNAELSPLLPILLDQKRFPRMEPNDRREVLFSITGTRISGKTIVERLEAKGAEAAKVKIIAPTLLAGFAAGCSEAQKKATESRGAWKAITGENYGSVKAEDWKAPRPEYDEAQLTKLGADIPAAKLKETELNTKLATQQERQRAWREREELRTALQARADRLERAKAKLKTDQDDVDMWTARVKETRAAAEGKAAVEPLACPHCAGLVEVAGSDLTGDRRLVMHEPPEKVADAKANALLPVYEDSLSKVTRFRDHDQRDVSDAEQAIAALAEFDKKPLEPIDITQLQRLEADLDIARKHLRSLEDSRRALEAKQEASKRADDDTAKAQAHHKDVVAWSKIAEWLAPAGIQSELMTEALKPFNDRLAGTASLTGWDKVTITPDMDIVVGTRPYSLASASAQWRAEAAITEAIAWVSKVRTFMLDEVELLVGPNRMTFLKWMHTLAANGNIDTAIIIGSFLERPKCPPTFQVEWLESGVLVHEDSEQAEAA